MLVHRQGCIRVQGVGGLIIAHRGIVLAAVVDTQAHCGAQATVDDGQFPIVFVIDLLASDEEHRAGEQSAGQQFLLVGHAAEELLEREHLINGILAGCRIFEVAVILRKGIALKLCAGDRAGQDQNGYNN